MLDTDSNKENPLAQQLKRWESPRRKGRNHKGRGGSAKQRQYKKRQPLLMKRLKSGIATLFIGTVTEGLGPTEVLF